jgi:hypothetical protein
MVFLSPRLRSLALRPCDFIVDEYWAVSIASLQFGVDEIDFSGISGLGNNILAELSQSKAAPGLRKLKLVFSHISDQSADCWKCFTSLEKLTFASKYATLATLRENLKLPKLRRLSFASSGCKGEDVLEEILAAKLTQLDISRLYLSSSPALGILKSLHERWPSPIEKLSFPDFYIVSSNVYALLLERFSHLKTLPAKLRSLASAIPFANLVKISVDQIDANLSQEDVNAISKALPQLETVYIAGDDQQRLDWSVFSSLTDLELHGISSNNSWSVKAFPPLLKRLSFHANHRLDPDPLQSLLPLSHLESLSVCMEYLLSKMQLLILLESLLNLKHLGIEVDVDVEPMIFSEICVVSHPKIESWQLEAISDADVVLGELPQLQRFVNSHPPTVALPSVYHVDVDLSEHIWFSTCLPKFPSLISLSLVVWGVHEAEWTTVLSLMPQLKQLGLVGAATSSSTLKRIGECLPALKSLSVFCLAHCGTGEVIEVGFPRLLNFSLVIGDRDHINIARLAFKDLNLACLTRMNLRVTERSILEQLDVDGLPNLGDLAVVYHPIQSASDRFKHRIRITRCPQLRCLSLSRVSAWLFEASDLPRLLSVTLTNCEIAPDASLKLGSFPSVLEFRIMPENTEFESRLKSATSGL